MSSIKDSQLKSILRSKIHKYINVSLINYDLTRVVPESEQKDLATEIKKQFVPTYDTNDKIKSLLDAFKESSNRLYNKDIKINNEGVVLKDPSTKGSWNFNTINKDIIEEIEKEESDIIPDDVSDDDRRVLKQHIKEKSRILKAVFDKNRKINKIKEDSKKLYDSNEVIFNDQLDFDGVTAPLINDNISSNLINDISAFIVDDNESYSKIWNNIFNEIYDISQNKYFKETIEKTKTYKAQALEDLEDTIDYLESPSIIFFSDDTGVDEDLVEKYKEQIKIFFDNHIKLLENIIEINNTNNQINTLGNSYEDNENKIKKIIDSYSIEKSKDIILASLKEFNDDRLLEQLSELFDNNTLNLSDTADFVIAEILQSLTSSPMTSNEIIDFMIKHQDLLAPPANKIKILTNIDNIGKQSLSIKKENVSSDGKFANRFGLLKEDYTRTDGVFDLNEIIYGNDESKEGSISRLSPSKENFNKTCPLMSYFMILDPTFRVGKRNELELSVFLNSLSTIELSKSTPYFNATFILPNEVTKSGKTYKTASVTQFLNGTKINNDESSPTVFNSLNQRIIKKDVEGIKSNMNLFTMPQTLNNFDDMYVGRNSSEEREVIKRITGYERANYIHDITRPFMTLKSFSIDVAPTQGLMSFKTGKVSLVIHDRTRMVDIAPFIKPDMFGVIGAELILSYGWSNISTNDEENYIGSFINSMKTTEKYVITNSSFNITKNGEVNVDLSIAMKGPIDIKNTMLTSDANATLNLNRLKTCYDEIEKLKNKLRYPKGSGASQYIEIREDYVHDIYISTISGKSEVEFINGVLSGSLNKYNGFIKSIDSILEHSDNEYHSQVRSFITQADNTRKLENFKTKFKEIFTDTSEQTFDVNVINASLHPENFVDISVALLSRYHEFFNTLKELIEVTNQKDKKTKKIVSKIMKGIENVDPFFDKEWSRDYKTVVIDSKTEYKINNPTQIINLNKSAVKPKKGDTKSNYVSLGMIVSSLLGVHLTKSGNYDDVQIISYNVNKKAGLMSNRNISSLLVPKVELEELISEILNTRKKISLEGILSRIIQDFVTTKKQVTYGLSDLKDDATRKDKTNESIDKRLAAIDEYLENVKSVTGETVSGPRQVEFQMPKVKMIFDSFVKKENIDRTILRITLYDDNDNPYKELSDMFTNDSLLLQYANQLNRTKLSRGKKSIEYKDKSIEIFNQLLKAEPPILVKKGDRYVLENNSGIVRAKKQIKKLVPSVTYGSQNSGIIDANVTTINEGNLNAVFMTRGERESGELKGTKVSSNIDLPLQVLPSKASITMFGCPFINFAQYMFLDFETGTTIDNFYAVTGINHNLTPGNFTTSLTLSYGDAYGKYISSINTLQNTFNDLLEGVTKSTKSISINKVITDLKGFTLDKKQDIAFKSVKINDIEVKIKEICKAKSFNAVKILNSNKSLETKMSEKTISYYQHIVLNGESDNILGEHLGSILLREPEENNKINLHHIIFRNEKPEHSNLIDDYEIDIDFKV